MLIQFSVGNYRSFKDIATFSLLAANTGLEESDIHPENIFITRNNLKLLKSAAIYGANASGKSNLASAIQFMRWFVVESFKEIQINGRIEDLEGFRLSTETEEKPSYFESEFIIEDKIYTYGFEVNRKQVISEWLFYQETNSENIGEIKLFERDLQEFHIEQQFLEGKGIQEKTRNNALFISVVAQFNGKISKEILAWFQNLYVISGLNKENSNTIKLLEKDKYKDKIIELVKRLDLGIHDIKLSSHVISKTNKKKSVLTDYWKYDSHGKKHEIESFSIDKNESEGTRKLFALAGILIDTLEKGKFLLIDEFDSSLHTLITCAIINLFHSQETNPNNAQSVFITHDTNLLSNKIFRRDQIWFTEKDMQEATHLYSLVEIKIRDDAPFDRDYIKGKYGGIPFVGDLRFLMVSEGEETELNYRVSKL